MQSIQSNVKYLKERYLLRWRFYYNNGTVSRYGAWSRHGNTPELQAWCQPKENLSVAVIEAKDIVTKEIKNLAICEGHDFVNFEWISAVGINPFNKESIKVSGAIHGLAIVTREKRAEIYIDGTTSIRDRTDYEKNTQQYASYGK